MRRSEAIKGREGRQGDRSEEEGGEGGGARKDSADKRRREELKDSLKRPRRLTLKLSPPLCHITRI